MLFATTFVTILVLSSGAKPPEYDEISNYIRGLTYIPESALVYRGKDIIDPGKPEGHLDSMRNFIYIKREKKNMASPNLNLGLIDLNDHRIYPGVLVRANDRLLDQRADVVAIDRNPMRYTVNLQGLTRKDGVFDAEPVFSEYQGRLEEAKNAWFVSHPDDQVTPAKFQVEKSMVHSKEQLKVKFGLSAEIVKGEIDFEAVHKNEKTFYVYKFIQSFYKVSIDYPKDPADVFGPKANLTLVKLYFDNENPPLFVESLTYGRVIYVTIETTSTEKDVRAALSAQFNKFSGKAEVDSQFKFENLRMSVFVYGGSPDHINIIKATSFKEVEDVITQFASFNRKNPGVPIFYTTAFLKDNTVARVSGMTEYTDVQTTISRSGTIRLENDNGYMTKWYLEWDEQKVDPVTGAVIIKHNSMEEHGDWKLVNFSKNVPVPGSAKNIYFKVEFWGGIRGWKKVREFSNVPLLANGRTFRLQNGKPISFWSVADPELVVTPHDDLYVKKRHIFGDFNIENSLKFSMHSNIDQ